MRYWVRNCISGLANEGFFHLEGRFLKEVILDAEGLEYLTGGERFFSAFGKPLVET